VPHLLHRRHFFFGSLGLALGCSRRANTPRSVPARLDAQRVSIVRAPSYSHDLAGLIRGILKDHGVAVAGKRILLKPNLVEFSAQAPINTSPVLVSAALEAFSSLGAARVTVAEGPGHRRMTLDMAEAAGFFSAIPRFEDRFVDLNIDDVRRVVLARPLSTLKELYLPNTAFDCDLLVSLPKMKTHHWAGATLSMKNLFGVVPGAVYGWPKNVLHWAGIDESIADLHYLFPRQFSIVDGIEAMEGNGPILGIPKHAGVIVAGAHAPSVDATCCQIMKIDPAKIGYLNLVSERSRWDWQSVRQSGETIVSVSTPFALHRDLRHLRLAG
jgi:uncharacterized protein (DUF362 family)